MHVSNSRAYASLLRRLAFCLVPLFLGAGGALVLLTVASGPPRRVYAGTLTFPGCASTIQGCIDLANDGDTILISAGDYTESLTLSKAVSLTGALSSTTILHALPNTRVLTVTGAAVGSSVVISGLTFTGGLVTGTTTCPQSCGGAILIANAAQPRLGELRVMSNTAAWYGGGLYSGGTVALTGGLFQGNECTQADCQGGGLYAAVVELTDTEFISNSAVGGGAYRASGGGLYATNADVYGGLFEGNQCLVFACDGGGLSAYQLSMTGTRFLTNTADGSGGGAAVEYASIQDVLFQANQATEGGGGGMSNICSCSTLSMINSSFISNTANGAGGGLAAVNATITGGRFQGNVAQAIGGGGLWDQDTLALTGTQFIRNSAVDATRGGAIYHSEIFVFEPGRIVNALFAGNTAEGGGNVMLADAPGGEAILHSTITSGSVGSGAALVILTGTVSVTDTIITSYTTGISLTGGSAYEDFNLFFGVPITVAAGVTSGGHSLAGNPNFQDPASDDDHLTAASPARDTGTDAGVTSDFEGDPRPMGGGFDIGYDEFRTPIAVADNYHVAQDTTLHVAAPGVLSNDTDFDLGPMTTTLASGPVTGTLNLGTEGSFTYTPTLGYSGALTFTYQANAASLLSGPAQVTIFVDRPPVALAGAPQTKTVGLQVTLDGSGSTDLQNYVPLAYGWMQTGGTAVVLSSATISRPTFTAPSAPTVLTFSLIVTDPYGLASPPATTTVTVTDQAITGLGAASSSPTVLGNATTFTASIAAGTNVTYAWGFGNGATGSGANTTYTFPTLGFYTALVTATNSLGGVTATTMVAVDDVPLAAGDAYSTTENIALHVAAPGVLANDSDVFPGGLTAQLVSGPATLVLAPTGAFTYTPPIGFGGLVTFTYQASDGLLLSPATTVTITVSAFKLYLPLVMKP